jgi:phage protein D
MAEPLLYSAAPVFAVDGAVRGELARDLIRLEVEEDTAGLKRLDARFVAVTAGADGAPGRIDYVDGAILDFGRTLRASIGPVDRRRIVFEGTITALEADFADDAAPVVRVLAEDALMDLRLTRRCRTYREVTDADIAGAIAADHGLRVDAPVDGPTYDVVQQLDQSDLGFLRDRARTLAAELWIADGTLHMATRDARPATAVTLVQGNDLLAVRVRADLAHQRTGVRVSGYDARQREPIDAFAGAEVVMAETATAGGGTTGPDVLRRALGAREDHLAREAPLTLREASAWARAEMLRRARAFVRVLATTRGTPDLVVGSRVTLQGVGAPFSGDGYYATRVRHTYDLRDGHRTEFEAERTTLATGLAA